MNKNLNCPNCGAPIEGSKCPYCGSVIIDFLNLDLDGTTPTYVRMRHNGLVHIFKARPTGFDIHYEADTVDFWADNQRYCSVCNPSYCLNLEMMLMMDEDLGKEFGVDRPAVAVTIDPEKFNGRIV